MVSPIFIQPAQTARTCGLRRTAAKRSATKQRCRSLATRAKCS